MRRARVLKTPSNTLCLFCASRLLPQSLGLPTIPTSTTIQYQSLRRRNLHTNPQPRQTATATAETSPPPPPPTSTHSFDPHSSLTAAEQAEKFRRLEAQRQHEQETRIALRERERERTRREGQQQQSRPPQRLRDPPSDSEHARGKDGLISKFPARGEGGSWTEDGHVSRNGVGGQSRAGRSRDIAVDQAKRESMRDRPTAGSRSGEQRGFKIRGLEALRQGGAKAAEEALYQSSLQQTRGRVAAQAAPAPVKHVAKPSFGAGAKSNAALESDRALNLREDEEGGVKPLRYRESAETEEMIAAREAAAQEVRERRAIPRTVSSDSRQSRAGYGTSMGDSRYRSGPSREYEALPISSSDLTAAHLADSTAETEAESEWPHLQARKPSIQQQRDSERLSQGQSDSGSYAPPRQQQQQQQQQSRPSPTDDWIERQFSMHQQQRRPPPQPRYGTANQSTSSGVSNFIPTARTPGEPPLQHQHRCARCLGFGHVARDCTGPVKKAQKQKIVCRTCGQEGHAAYECLQNQRQQKSDRDTGRDSRSLDRANSAGGNASRGPDLSPEAKTSADGPATVRQAASTETASFNPFAAAPAEGRSAPSTQRSEQHAQQQDNPSIPVEDTRRRSRRSSRGFEDDSEVANSDYAERRPRRQNRKAAAQEEDDEAADDAAASREERAAAKAARKAAKRAELTAEKAKVNLPDFISLSNLAQALDVRYEAFVARLEKLGYEDIFPGKVLDAEVSGMIAMEYNYDPVYETTSTTSGLSEDAERDLRPRPAVADEDKQLLPTRPPVVTIMGHVDHGKTTLLDYLRKSSVAAGEAGGITQHIGAFSVPLSSTGRTVTFLDTPGHAAFLAMRQRGANVTDIVILVVAADDSVKPQTLESLRCAREAGVPIIVAINKVDKEEADVQRVKQDLARAGVEIENFGGETQVVLVSGKTGEGLDELEEAVVTLSEILDFRAETDGEVEGWVLEATTKTRGRVATVLVKRGTLKSGAVIVAGKAWGRVRTLRNAAGELVVEAGPGMPVEVDGWRDQPVAGDSVLQASGEQKAGDVVAYRVEREARGRMVGDMEAVNLSRRVGLEKRAREKAAEVAAKGGGELSATAATGAMDTTTTATTAGQADASAEPTHQLLPLIIKADVSGSAEALTSYLSSLSSPLISPQILESAVGPINESDLELASAAQGHIIAFNLPANEGMKAAAESRGCKVLVHDVIYRVLEDVRGVMEDRLPPVVTSRVLGEAEVGAVFDIKLSGSGGGSGGGAGGKKVVWIAGCRVRNGVLSRGGKVRVLRGGEKIYDGVVASLKNVKKDVEVMRKGGECGIGFENGWEGFQVGDLVQCFEEIREKRRLQ